MTITALSDAELLEQARAGDEAAFTELYVRHQPAALRLARSYRRLGDPDELVNGAFERVLGAIKRGAGPTDSFRAYLFVTLRRFAAEKAEKPDESSLDEVPEPIVAAADSPALAQADRTIITQAFESLPDRWQAVLWHTAVEGRPPRELADTLGVSANAAAAMSYRAREKLRQAYLQAHLLATPAPDHEPYRSQLGGYVRGGLSARDTAAVDKHLQGCESCRALVAELEDVNRTLARAVLPLFLLVGGGKLGAAALAGGAAAGAGAKDGGFGRKLRNLAPTVGSSAAIIALVAGMVGMGSAVARQDGGPMNSAADAADLGTDDEERVSSDDADRDSLFDDDDFAISPFDDEYDFGDDFGFGDDFDYDGFGLDDFDFDDFSFDDDFDSDFSAPSRRPASRVPSGGGGTGGTGGTAGPSPSPPPTDPGTNPQDPGPGPGPDPDPGPDPVPTPLAFSSQMWTPTAIGAGDLSVGVGEQGAGAAVTPSASLVPLGLGAPTPAPQAGAQAAGEPLRVELTLTPGARVDPAGLLDPRCTPPTDPGAGQPQVVTCSLDQPAAGGGTSFVFPLRVTGAGQTANMVLFRGATEESRFTAPVDLTPYEAGLTLSVPDTWVQARSPSGVLLPVGNTSVGVTNTGAHPVAGVSIDATIALDAAFVPPGTNVDEALGAIGRRMDSQGWWGPDFLETFRPFVTTPLPDGCTISGWTMPAGFRWSNALVDGLPRTVTCEVGTLQPGESRTFDGLALLGQPAFWDGNGISEAGVGTATLRVGGTAVGQPGAFTVPITPPQPRPPY